MARGFDSKWVADQQESALERRSRREEPPPPGVLVKRRRLELARADVLRRIETVESDAYREMLRRALAALEKDLADLA